MKYTNNPMQMSFFQSLFRRKFTSDSSKSGVYQIDIAQIKTNISQPRHAFDVDSIVRLADSIRQYGILQPLILRRACGEDGYRYELIAGERRLRAAKMLGLKNVPCLISEADDAESAEKALVENMLRQDLNYFEQAEAFSLLADKYGLTQDEIARKMSLSQSAVANKLRILRLTPDERKLIIDANLTERHARAFLRISVKSARLDIIKKTIQNTWTVAETESAIQDLLNHDGIRKKKENIEISKGNVRLTSEIVCTNINRYLDKLQSVSDLVTVDKQIVGSDAVITLTVRNAAVPDKV